MLNTTEQNNHEPKRKPYSLSLATPSSDKRKNNSGPGERRRRQMTFWSAFQIIDC